MTYFMYGPHRLALFQIEDHRFTLMHIHILQWHLLYRISVVHSSFGGCSVDRSVTTGQRSTSAFSSTTSTHPTTTPITVDSIRQVAPETAATNSRQADNLAATD